MKWCPVVTTRRPCISQKGEPARAPSSNLRSIKGVSLRGKGQEDLRRWTSLNVCLVNAGPYMFSVHPRTASTFAFPVIRFRLPPEFEETNRKSSLQKESWTTSI